MGNNKISYDNDSNSSEEFTNFLSHKEFKTESKYVDGTLKFYPPVYVQRYEAVSFILEQHSWKDSIKKVVDFGCSEMGFFLYLKNIPSIEKILEIDVDDRVLDQYCTRVQPLYSDYLFSKRSTPLEVYLMTGNISEYDDILADVDAVIAIELIEHLEADILQRVPHNIFHEIKPKLAIFTTPNADFNILFPNISRFRHVDHKFEWSRREFSNWTKNIIQEYPNYSVKIYGIGKGPEGTENFGCCTQMAVFERLSEPEDQYLTLKGIRNYKLIRKVEYPYFVDTRTNEEKVVDEVLYRVKFSINASNFYNYDEHISEIPISEFMEYVSQWCESVEQLSQILIDNELNLKESNGEYVLLYAQNTPGNSVKSDSDLEDEDMFQEQLDEDCEFEDWSLEYERENVEKSYCDKTFERLPSSSKTTTMSTKAHSQLVRTFDSDSCLEYDWESKEPKKFCIADDINPKLFHW